MKAIQVVLLSLLFAVVAISGPSEPAVADGADLKEFRQAALRALGTSKDQARVVLVRYGHPDLDDSTAYDHPRPPIVLRWIDYQRAGVRALFVPNDGLGEPPPYTWTLFGFVDIAGNKAISFEEGDRRLREARR
jgi:hypothetical protein